MNKHPLLNWHTFSIVSLLLVIVYAAVVACSYESRSAHWLAASSIAVFLFILTHATIILASSNLHVPECSAAGETGTSPWYKTSYGWAIAGSVFIAYTALALLLSTSWLKGDDFTFMGHLWKNTTMEAAWDAATHRYSTWVARFGDFFAVLFPLSESRWQVWLINPALVVSIPFALFRLFRTDTKDTIASSKGLVFFWFCFFLFLLSAEMPHWRNYWCYAASTNYLWPSVGFIWLVSCYNPCNWNKVQASNAEMIGIGLFILGFICGWGMECTAVTMVPMLVLWVVYNWWRKIKLPVFCWAGVIGVVWGAYVLFASPSHASRLETISKSRKLDIYSMTPEQITDFVQNLDWDKVNMLKGAASLTSLDGIPLWQHVYFLPYLWERFWNLSNVAFCFSAVLLISLLCSNRYKQEGKRILVVVGMLLFACVMACSYLAASIPQGMSYLPCAFMVASACAMLFFMHSDNSCFSARQLIVSVVLSIIGLMYFVPAAIEGIKLYPYRIKQQELIHQMQQQGHEHIVLPYPVPFPPENRLCLFAVLSAEGDRYPNRHAARTYKVRTIRQLPYKKPVPPRQEANTQGK